MREIEIDRDPEGDGDGEIRRYLEDFAAGFECGPVGTEEFSGGVAERRRQRGLAGDDLAGPFPPRPVAEARKARPATAAKQPAFAWPLGVASGVLFEVIPGSERNAGGLAGTVVRGARIATQAEVPDSPRSSWPADSVEWVSLGGLVGLEPKEARAWLELAEQWANEERGTGVVKRRVDDELLEALRADALAVILEERKCSRRKRKAAASRETGAAG